MIHICTRNPTGLSPNYKTQPLLNTMFELIGKNALVAGAAKRIGNAIALGLAKQGANVIIHCDRSENEARKLEHEIIKLGVKSWLIKSDFNDPKSSEQLIEGAHKSSGGIDMLVNNASIFFPNDVNDVRLEDINLSMLTNARANDLCSQASND